MKLFSRAGVVPWSILQLQHVAALSNITFYSDSSCQTIQSLKTGPDDGTCTPFPSDSAGYLSFMVTSLDQTCAVTVYGSDVPYCSSATLFLAPFSDCMTATNVSQFSVDCQDLSVATSAIPSIAPTSAPSASATASSSNDGDGLSGGAKAGIAIAAAVGGLAFIGLIVFFVVRSNRRKRADMEARRVQEADSQPAAPPYNEMGPSEKKLPLNEMHSPVPQEIASSMMVPVEAPGDERWGPPQELPGDSSVDKKLAANIPPQKVDTQTVLSEGTTVVESDGNRNSNAVSDPRT